jgi:hypothetical protein
MKEPPGRAFTDLDCRRGLKNRILTAGRAWASSRRVRRWQRFIGGIEDELRAVFERERDAHLLVSRDRNDGDDALPKGALQFVVAGQIAVRPVLRKRGLKVRL